MKWINPFKRKLPEKQLGAPTQIEPSGDASTNPGEISQKAEIEMRLSTAKQQHREGRIADADAVYRDILKSQPDHADARHMVAIVCLERGELIEAENHFRRAIALDANQARYYSNLGNALGEQNRTEEALACFREALELDPEHLGALRNSATALLSLGRGDEAKDLCLKILGMEPHDIGARLNLAAAHIDAHDMHEAIAVLREGLSIHPNNVDLLFQLASALELANQIDEASEVIELAENIQPGIARTALVSGLIARRQQKFDVAEQRLRLAIKLGLPEPEMTEAFNQLGLALDAMGKSEDAFNAFEQSNLTMRRLVGKQNSDGSAYLHGIDLLKRYFTKDRIAELCDASLPTHESQPVFFVGFPRSGTTLMEQVLKAHPMLITTEERSPLSAVIREIQRLPGGYPQALDNLTDSDLNMLRQHFHDFCRETLGEHGNKQVVDKLPLNIVHLGLAKRLFPQAKIVVALRDPRDVCLSCFMQKFKINDAMANFLDLQSTGLTYQAVMGLWLHYRSEMNGSWLEYRYEDLVNNFDDCVSQVLEFIGVGWHEDIGGYRQAAKKRIISTPSYRDVTGPINNRALARWRRYETQLAPILPVLEPFVEAFGYKDP